MIKIDGRKLIIPRGDSVIGFQGDNLVEIREFEINRFYGAVDLSLFDFKLDIKAGTNKNIIDLDKEVTDDKIILTWTVLESHLVNDGLAQIQVRGFSGSVVKWHSDVEYILVKDSINASDVFTSPLPSEFEEMEICVTAAKNTAVESAAAAKESELAALAKLTEVVTTNEALEENIIIGSQTKQALDKSITDSGTAKEELDGSITTAGTTKTALDGSINTAGTTKTALDGSINTAGTKKTELDGSILNAGTAQSDLQAVINSSKINELIKISAAQPAWGLWLEEV